MIFPGLHAERFSLPCPQLHSKSNVFRPQAMSISSLLAKDHVFPDAHVTSKKRLLEMIADKAADHLHIPQKRIFSRLLERERLGSTGLGLGFAVPHARLEGLDRIHACFLKLDQPVPFDAADQQPVDLVFVLFVPEDSTDEHLQVLASLARIFSQPRVAEAIRHSHSGEEITEILRKAEAGD
jgi:PTS system nitrogen regulatory IIA component